MSDSIISVIVPIYNTGKYLNRCVDSIANQTYRELEIILVDDGSTDNCSNICDEYAFKDNRIKVIHKSNGGLSSARNAGLDVATGDFISFVDSDDWIEIDALEKLVTTIKNSNSSVCCMKNYIVDYKYNIIRNQANNTLSVKLISSEEHLKLIFKRAISESVCDKMFSAKVIKDCRFDERKLNEDFLFLTSVLQNNDFIISLLDYAGYNYYQRFNSISKIRFGKSTIDAVYNADKLAHEIKENKKSLVNLAGAYAAYQARAAIISMPKKEYKNNKEFVKYCNDIIKSNRKYIKNSFMTSKDKFFCYLNIIFPKIAKFFADVIVKQRAHKS